MNRKAKSYSLVNIRSEAITDDEYDDVISELVDAVENGQCCLLIAEMLRRKRPDSTHNVKHSDFWVPQLLEKPAAAELSLQDSDEADDSACFVNVGCEIGTILLRMRFLYAARVSLPCGVFQRLAGS